MFCKHEWKVLSDVMMPSAYEQQLPEAEKMGVLVDTINQPHYETFVKAHHVVLECVECGKLKNIVVYNPPLPYTGPID